MTNEKRKTYSSTEADYSLNPDSVFEVVTGLREPGFLTSFNLVNLVLAEDNRKLTLKINPHERVAIPTVELHKVAKRYVLGKIGE